MLFFFKLFSKNRKILFSKIKVFSRSEIETVQFFLEENDKKILKKILGDFILIFAIVAVIIGELVLVWLIGDI